MGGWSKKANNMAIAIILLQELNYPKRFFQNPLEEPERSAMSSEILILYRYSMNGQNYTITINYKASVKLLPFLRDGRGCYALCRNCLSMWPVNILPSELA